MLAVRVSTAFLGLHSLHSADTARPVANSTRSTKTSEQHRPPPAACLASSVSSSATTYSPDLLETSFLWALLNSASAPADSSLYCLSIYTGGLVILFPGLLSAFALARRSRRVAVALFDNCGPPITCQTRRLTSPPRFTTALHRPLVIAVLILHIAGEVLEIPPCVIGGSSAAWNRGHRSSSQSAFPSRRSACPSGSSSRTQRWT